LRVISRSDIPIFLGRRKLGQKGVGGVCVSLWLFMGTSQWKYQFLCGHELIVKHFGPFCEQ